METTHLGLECGAGAHVGANPLQAPEGRAETKGGKGAGAPGPGGPGSCSTATGTEGGPVSEN